MYHKNEWCLIHVLWQVSIHINLKITLGTVGCAFQMVILSELRLGQYWDDDHREDAPHFSNFVSPEVLKRLYRKVIFWFLWECSKVLFWIIKRKWFFAWLIRIKYWIWDVNSKNSPTQCLLARRLPPMMNSKIKVLN